MPEYAIGELFELLVAQAREKERKFVVEADGETYEIVEVGVDGETYAFSITDKNGEIRTGVTWSPHPSNKPMLSRLVKICDDLFSLEDGNINSQTSILREINTLINDFKR